MNLTPPNLKNMFYFYKLTSPYNKGPPTERDASVGMQTEQPHMDSCNLANREDTSPEDEFCELSSIIFTRIENELAENYYASSTFFYAPEIPIPTNAEDVSTMNIRTGRILPNFQKNYNRFFVSVPMTTGGWAIWKNKPKRLVRNETGNRFNIIRDNEDGFNQSIFKKGVIPWGGYFSAQNDEFLMHASPFDAFIDVDCAESKWAPKTGPRNRIIRSNITIRRGNYNLFKVCKDLFLETDDIKNKYNELILKSILSQHKANTPLNENLNWLLFIKQNETITPDIQKNISEIWNDFIDGKINNIVNGKEKKLNKYEFENAYIMLLAYIGSLLAKLPKTKSNPDNWEAKYLKYKNKYLKLKALLKIIK